LTTRRRLAAGAAAGLLLLLALVVFRAPLARHGLEFAAGAATGYQVSIGAAHLGASHATLDGIGLRSASGEPVATVRRLELSYALRDLFGSPHPFGVSGVALYQPQLFLVHHRDGTWNVSLPSGGGASSGALPAVRVRLRDGSVSLVDETRLYPHSRKLGLEAVQFEAALDPAARSAYTGSFDIREPEGRFPVSGRATFDPGRGYELQRWRAARVALGPLIDYALNTSSLHVAGGELRDLDARLYALRGPDGSLARHVAATAGLQALRLYLNGLSAPLRDGAGPLAAYDDGLAIPRVSGTIAGIPVRVAGAIYGLAQPAVRLGIVGRGDLRRLAGLTANAGNVAVGGSLDFGLLVEGSAAQPLTLANLTSARAFVNGYPLDRIDAQAALAGSDLDVVHSSLRYGPVGVGARGLVALQKTHQSRLVAQVEAPSGSLPLFAYALPGMRLGGLAVLSGSGTALSALGRIDGTGPGEALTGTFDVGGDGKGSVGPLELAGPGRQRLFATVSLQGPRNAAAWVQARGLRLGSRPLPALPGVRTPALPEASGELDADVAGLSEGKRFLVAGDASLTRARLRGIALGELEARGYALDGSRTALAGRYRGALEPLGQLAGARVAARGSAEIPFALVGDGRATTVAQIAGARFRGAEVAGLRIDGLAATVGLAGQTLEVYAARARLDGHDIIAQGRLGSGGTLQVSAGGLDLAALRGFGVPLERGELTAVAQVGGTEQAPTVEGGFVGEGTLRGVGVSASSALRFAGDRLTVSDGLVQAGTAVGTLEGAVDGVRTRPAHASYAVHARLRDADIASLASAFTVPLQYPAGTLDGDLAVSGSGSAPSLEGSLAIPEGSLNGLAFSNAAVGLRGSARELALQAGRVTVGSSTLAFAGTLAPGAQTFTLHAPRLDLADFNDYFDRGDTLGGRGRLDLSARAVPGSISLFARTRIDDAQFRRLDLGTIGADVATTGRTVHLAGSIGGSTGLFTINGSVQLPQSSPFADTVRRSELELTARAEEIDLATWLPAVGLRQPISGRVNGVATVSGRYPALALTLQAALEGGRFGRVAIEGLSLQAHAQNGRVTIGSAALAIAGLDLQGSGTLGLRPSDPFALKLQAAAPDLAELYATVTGKTAPDGIGGALNATAHFTGTARDPHAHGELAADALTYRGYTLPHAQAALDASTSLVALQSAEFDFAQGRIRADGRIPLELQPAPGIGPASAPIFVEFNADDVALGQFAPLLPKGTDLDGVLAGRLGVLGTIAKPALNGTLALVDFSFSSPQERAKLTGGEAQLTFAGTAANLHDAHVDVGGGTIRLLGSASVPSLREPGRDLAANLSVTAAHAGFDLPAYFKGAVDGKLSLTKAPGAPANLVGDLTFNDTRIPLNAVLGASGPSPTATPNLPDVALNLLVSAQRDVRVQSGQVDIGAQGSVRVRGSLQNPTLAGRLVATDGTLDFYRTFVLGADSAVAFTPALGLVPRVNAYATTSIPDPPTQVALHVTGPATQLNVALQSDPPYTREQIVGLLAGLQNLGAVQGVTTTQSGAQNQNFVGNLAAGQLSSLFTRNVLEPLGAHIGSAVGLSSLSLGYDPSAGLGLGARKAILKNLDVIYAESFNYPHRTTLGLRASPTRATALQMTFFTQEGSGQFSNAPATLIAGDPAVTASQPFGGVNGFSLSLQRKFR
jgi:autotransporter translocation and assembly factor TamB